MRVDRIFEGGTLLTMDLARPRATALAVLGGRIVAVGDGDELRRHLRADRVVSLQGRTVVPGFHDAHNHMPAFGMGLGDIPLSARPITRVADILVAVKARAARQPAGSWIIRRRLRSEQARRAATPDGGGARGRAQTARGPPRDRHGIDAVLHYENVLAENEAAVVPRREDRRRVIAPESTTS